MNLLVAITTVNGPDRVFAVWRSFQNFPPKTPVKFLVVDDGSDAHHMPNAIDYVTRSLEIPLFRHVDENGHAKNMGISAAWNSACGEAKRQGFSHALILNDDIEILPGAVDAAVFMIEKNKDVAVVGLPPYSPTPTGLELHWPQIVPTNKPYLCMYAMGCSFVVDLSRWEEIGGFDQRFLSHFEDVDFGLRLLEKNYLSVQIPQGVLHGWSKTFQANAHLQGHTRLEVSRVLFKRKWSKNPPEFSVPSCLTDGRIFEYIDKEGNAQQTKLPFARFGAMLG